MKIEILISVIANFANIIENDCNVFRYYVFVRLLLMNFMIDSETVSNRN